MLSFVVGSFFYCFFCLCDASPPLRYPYTTLYYVLFGDDLGCILGQLVGVFRPVIFGAIIRGVCRDEKCGKIWRKKNPKKSYKKLAVKKL